MPRDLENWLDDVYQTGGNREQLDGLYDDWALSYDQDLWSSGNPYIALMAGMVGRYVPDPAARILDGGCGTGNMGQVLHQMGYSNIVGIDASDGMLAAAEAKGCYRELHKMLLGPTIDQPDESFDAVTAAGVLTHGHAPPDALDGLLGIARKGAPIIFSISRIAVEDGGFGTKMTDLETAGAWRLQEQTEPFRTYPFSEQYADLRHWISVYRKTG